LNAVVVVSPAVDSLPPDAGVLVPDQPPEATHDVAFVEDQVRVDDPPLAIRAGFAVSDTTGADTPGGAGGVPVGAGDDVPTWRLCWTAPPPQAANATASIEAKNKVFVRSI
jgi:hypothetical protein